MTDDDQGAKARRYREAGFDVRPAASYPGHTYRQAGHWLPLAHAPETPPERLPAANA